MKKLFIVILILGVFGCGQEARQTRDLHPVAESNPLSGDYQFGVCGTLSNEAGNGTGGSEGYFMTSSNSQRFSIIASSQQAQSTLSQISQGSQTSGCVYSNSQSQQGYEGMVIQAQEITL